VINILGLAADPDGNQHLVASSVTIVGSPTHGGAVANSNGTISYTANAGFHGSDVILYTITDDNGGTSLPGTITIITK
jgi:hypothetical protein